MEMEARAGERRSSLRAGRISGCRCSGSLGLGAVHKIFQFFARLEERNLLRRHVDFFAGFGIAPNAPAPLPRAEAAKSANLNLLALLQGPDDAVKNRFDDGFRFFSREFR